MISSRPKEGAGSCFKFVRWSNDLITQKVYVFHAVNASLLWLNNASFSPGFLALIGQQGFGAFHHVSALASHWLEYCASLSLALLVCRSNMFFTRLRCLFHLATQLTLLSQRKLALTTRNTLVVL
jgi:hypothetical protein